MQERYSETIDKAYFRIHVLHTVQTAKCEFVDGIFRQGKLSNSIVMELFKVHYFWFILS